MYKIPLQAAVFEFTEKKSRFISRVSPVSSEEEALAFLSSIRGMNREATHNVYAYRIKSNNICRYSDDGEPSGTAGMPLLEAFLKQDIFDFCCVATRYYGGILLGAGGLVRAYARCGAAALEASGVGIMRELTLCATVLPYPLYESTKRIVSACGAEISSEDFGASVELRFSLPSGELEALQRKLTESSSGSVNISVEGIRMGAAPYCPEQ